MRTTAEVLVVGAGVIGCAVARELSGRGAAVTVIERGQPGEEASWAAAGLLSPQVEAERPGPLFDLALESRRLYPEWATALQQETGLEVGYRRTGLLRCAVGQESFSDLCSRYLWQRERGESVEPREASALERELGGLLSDEVRGAVFFPEEAVVHSRRLVRALRLSAERRGVRILSGTPASRFLLEGGACRGVETADGRRLMADRVVNAAGAWAAFDPALPLSLPVEPVRGQIVELAVKGRSLPMVIQSEEVYLLPRPDGTVLAGATVEFVGFEKEVTAEAVARLIGAALRLIPSLASAGFATAWSGLRPGTPDGLPLLGESGVPGLLLATGHFRSGILLAPVTASLLADLVVGAPARDLSPYSAARFAPPAA
jgi:glycine oxidase